MYEDRRNVCVFYYYLIKKMHNYASAATVPEVNFLLLFNAELVTRWHVFTAMKSSPVSKIRQSDLTKGFDFQNHQQLMLDNFHCS